MLFVAFAALQPWVAIEVTGRAIMLIVLLPIAFLWFYTDWSTRPQRRDRRSAAASPSSEQVGRSAGRTAANTLLAGKRAFKKYSGE